MDTDRPIRYWRTVRIAGAVACCLGLLTLVAWYIPHHSLQNCRHAQMLDCSISEDNPINYMWGWVLLLSLIGTISSISVVITNALFAWKKPKSFEKAMVFFSFGSVVTILICIYLPRWIREAFPGNTINWRHDQAMSAIWWDVWIASVVLFIMSIAAAVTCLFLIYRPKISISKPKYSTVLRIIWWLAVVIIVLWALANRNPY